ncbi:MAG: MobQ family relaxase [Xanthobacteraceae bacterium]
MPSYHFSAQVIRRSQGRSAIKAAAYRAGERLRDEGRGKVYDFTRRRGVAYREILLPTGAPSWLKDRSRLWNYAEQIEARRDAQLAREINIALPHELDAGQRRKLLLNFVQEAFVSRGMVADIAFHDPVPEKGDHPENFHAHVMLTLRQATSTGLRRVKTREWNSDELLLAWRGLWAEHQNQALERAGVRSRVDHRTLKAQREDAERRGDRPQAFALGRQPEIHVGPKAHKAALSDKSLVSRDQPRGPYRRHRPNENARRRVVHYTKFDRGSRYQRNQEIIRQNFDRLSREITRWQRRSARFKATRHWIAQNEYQAMLEAERQRQDAKRRRLWRKRRDQEAVWRTMTEGDRWQKRRKKRKTLLDHLIDEIDRTLRQLLGIRDHLARRHSAVNQRRPWRSLLGRSARRGRYRARHPTGRATRERDNA